MPSDSEGKDHKQIHILYEDADVIVINKPAGLLVHGDGRNTGPTVVDWFLLRVPDARGVGEPGRAQDGTPLERSGVVHRLDKDTSGALILVKNQSAFAHLKAQFHDRTIRKEYRAFVYGAMKDRWGTIDRPIGRSVKDFRLRSAERGARGMLRPSVTEWEVIAQSNANAYLRLLPKTGRTHQLRVHLKSISRPIIGDTLYAPLSLRKGDDLGFTRLALHAWSVAFRRQDGEEVICEAPLPPDFEAAIALLR
jgi:23S rRNA pseudouridine1911/1915/1917 synthase